MVDNHECRILTRAGPLFDEVQFIALQLAAAFDGRSGGILLEVAKRNRVGEDKALMGRFDATTSP